MSDEHPWQAPGSAQSSPASSPWATPAASSSSPAQPDAGRQQPPPVWTPPPKPGLIPLRPLSFGTIMGSSFRVMRRNPAATFGLSALLYGFILILFALVFAAYLAFALPRLSNVTGDDQSDVYAGTVALLAVVGLLPVGLSIAASAVVQGILSLEVSRATLGEKLKVRGLWRLARGRIGTLVLWALLTTAALTAIAVVGFVVLSVAIGIISIFAVSTSVSAGAVIGGTLLLLFVSVVVILAFVALSVWLGIKTALVPSIIVVERLSLSQAIARSWRLTRGHFWRTVGIQLLIFIIMYIASTVISTPLQIIAYVMLGLFNPMGETSTTAVAGVVLTIAVGVVSIATGAIQMVLQSCSLTLIYIDIRMRKEGLDLELLQYVEQKGTASGVLNPYLRTGQAQTATATSAAAGSPWA